MRSTGKRGRESKTDGEKAQCGRQMQSDRGKPQNAGAVMIPPRVLRESKTESEMKLLLGVERGEWPSGMMWYH